MKGTAVPTSGIRYAKYVGIFVGVQALLGLAIASLESVVRVDLGAGSGVGAIVAAVVAAMYAFAKDHGRGLTRGEQLRFAICALVGTYLWTALLSLVVLRYLSGQANFGLDLSGLLQYLRNNAGLATAAVVGATIFLLAILYGLSGYFSRLFARQLAGPPTSS